MDEELLLDGTWGNFDGVPNPEYLKKKTVGAETVEKHEGGQAAADTASGDTAAGDDKHVAADSDDKTEDEGTEEKQLERLHFFRSKVHVKDVNRLVVASFVSRYLWSPRLLIAISWFPSGIFCAFAGTATLSDFCCARHTHSCVCA